MRRIIKIAKNTTAKQTMTLFASQIILAIFSLLNTLIVTRALGSDSYGIYAFVMTVIVFVSIFFEFGFFSSGTRLLAIANNETEERQIIGAEVVTTLIISILFLVTLFALSFVLDLYYHNSSGHVLRAISILAAAYPFQQLVQQLCQGNNKIYRLSLMNILPAILYFSGLLIMREVFRLDIITVLLLNYFGVALVCFFVIRSLKPDFKRLPASLSKLLIETKEYGFKVYIGRALSTSTYDLDKVFISFFIGTTAVGFYNLAIMMIGPMVMFSQALSSTMFKQFSSDGRISKKIIFYNFIFLSTATLALIIFGKSLVNLLFSTRFDASIPLILPFALAGFFQGMYQPFNFFLAAHRKGKYLQFMSVLSALANITLNYAFIKIYGVIGGALASLAVCLIYFVACVLFYRKTLKEERVSIHGNYLTVEKRLTE